MKAKATSVIERIRSFINKARLTSANPNSTPDLSHIMMAPKFRRQMYADKDVTDRVWATGLAKLIADYLKHTPNGDFEDTEELTQTQLELWPKKLQEIVADIHRARVYVPSRMEYVPLTPACLSKPEAFEAGKYLIAKGQENIRVGKRLLQLSDFM